jgi:hypothetical protein
MGSFVITKSALMAANPTTPLTTLPNMLIRVHHTFISYIIYLTTITLNSITSIFQETHASSIKILELPEFYYT